MSEACRRKPQSKNEITEDMLFQFATYLRTEERSEETITKYMRSLRAFRVWLGMESITKEKLAQWKEELVQSGMAAVTINGMLAAIHSFLGMLGLNECRVKYLKVQRQMFRDASRELGREEFGRLVTAAQKAGNERMSLLLEAICSTGVRVSEVKYLTIEAIKQGKAEIALKGKIRTILIPSKLVKKLLQYCKRHAIDSGEVFITTKGKGMSRRQIWGEMKRLCKAARVEERKVYPHNLRHLFARVYYKACKDIVQLADVLGHSSIETTRIYLITTSTEHARRLNQLGLIT